jgi:hypothetical protein
LTGRQGSAPTAGAGPICRKCCLKSTVRDDDTVYQCRAGGSCNTSVMPFVRPAGFHDPARRPITNTRRSAGARLIRRPLSATQPLHTVDGPRRSSRPGTLVETNQRTHWLRLAANCWM